MSKPLSRRRVSVAVLGAVALAVAGCGSSSSSSSSGGSGGSAGSGSGGSGSLTVGELEAFSGPNAVFGQSNRAACVAAIGQINAAGGVMGHTLNCQVYDTKGDPADALPVTTRMIASASNLAVIEGPSDETPVTLPITSQAKIPSFSTIGSPKFDTNTDPYFWRITPSDALGGRALAFAGINLGYKHAAAVFTSDSGAQTSVVPLTTQYAKLGGKLALSLTLAPGQTSYRTEVAKVIAAKPDAIFTEMDPQTAATFFSEMQQLNGGKIPPVVGTNRDRQADWVAAVTKAISPAVYIKDFTTAAPEVVTSGPAYLGYKSAILGIKGKVTFDPSVYVDDLFARARYDAITIAALAMTAAKSTNPATYDPWILKVTQQSPGAIVVHTFAEGVKQLHAGHTIQYSGPSGAVLFDKYHNALAAFDVGSLNPTTNQIKVRSVVSAKQLSSP